MATLAVVVLSCLASPARAQWGYPGGFGDFGWFGWGASTVHGDEARGMGVFAAGLGQYNLATARADAINADTAMRFNEYMWEAQQAANQRYYRRLAERQRRVAETAAATYSRLRDNPEGADVHRGDALNVLLDELSAPGVYTRAAGAGQAPLSTALVKELPFRYAPQAITISLDELLNRVPDLIKAPAFDKQRLEIKALVARARSESEDDGEISLTTLRSTQAAIKALHDKIRSDAPAGRNRNEADNFLKAAFGLARMLESPEIGAFLKELDRVETTSLAALLGFMFEFNLRFGVATTPRQRTAYDDLFPKLRALRSQLFPRNDAPIAMGAPEHPHPEWAERFFSGMDLDEIQQKKPLTPAPPRPDK
jgi:hypothetical protein